MSRRTKMEYLAAQIEEKYNALYFSENHPDIGKNDNLHGCRYFLLYKSTFGIFRKYKTQQEAIENMVEILKEDPSELFNSSLYFA